MLYHFNSRIQLVESIPEGLVFNGTVKHLATFDVWKNLIRNASSSIEIASFYWTLRENETYPHPSSKKVVISASILRCEAKFTNFSSL